MKLPVSMLGIAMSVACAAPAIAADGAAGDKTAKQDRDECKHEEHVKGHGDNTSSVICAVKSVFQSRIRRKADDEPVEMVVGSPPMQTDDTDTPGAGNWETNILATGMLAGSEHRIEAPVLDINYGIGDTVQLTYSVPYVFAKGARDPADGGGFMRASGIGDSGFGVKYRFYDNSDNGLSFAIYPQIEFRTPGASRKVSEGDTAFILPIVMTREFEEWSFGANAGVEVAGGDRTYFGSLGVGRRLSAHVALLAEVVGTDINTPDAKRGLVNVGLRWKLSEHRALSGSIGRDFYAGGDQRKANYFALAFQQSFGE